MPTIKLKLSDDEARMLDELSSFEGESLEDTLRISLRNHYADLRQVKAEADELRQREKEQGAQNPEKRSKADDDIVPF